MNALQIPPRRTAAETFMWSTWVEQLMVLRGRYFADVACELPDDVEHNFHEALQRDDELPIASYHKALCALSDAWPEGLKWPAHIARPEAHRKPDLRAADVHCLPPRATASQGGSYETTALCNFPQVDVPGGFFPENEPVADLSLSAAAGSDRNSNTSPVGRGQLDAPPSPLTRLPANAGEHRGGSGRDARRGRRGHLWTLAGDVIGAICLFLLLFCSLFIGA